MSVDLLRAIERAAVRGWPSLESSDVDGWVWRHASGGSIRANSVATLTWRGGDIGSAIAACEAMYRARGAPSVFTISDVSEPAGLDATLDARSYMRGDDHVTMAKSVSPIAPWPAEANASTTPSEQWFATYLSGLSEDRRGVARRLIGGLPAQAQFISIATEGVVGSCGMSVVDREVASVQCMATLPHFRRRGGAQQVLAAIEALALRAGAKHLYLQTGGDNLAAQALYAKFGFSVAGRYHTRTKRI